MQIAKRIGLAGKLSFAHLAGIGSRKAAAEGDEPEEKDDDKAKAAAESDDDKQPDAATDEPESKAEGGPDDEEPDGDEKKDAKAEHDEPDGDEPKSAKAARSAKSAKSTRAAVEAERDRCKQIIAHGVKLGAVKSAGVFAFDTDMTAEQAIAALDAARADGADGRSAADASAARAARNPQLGTGSPLERDSQAAAQAGWDKAIAKYAPRKR